MATRGNMYSVGRLGRYLPVAKLIRPLVKLSPFSKFFSDLFGDGGEGGYVGMVRERMDMFLVVYHNSEFLLKIYFHASTISMCQFQMSFLNMCCVT